LIADDTATQAAIVATLREQRHAWDTRPAVRHLYTRWFGLVAEQLANLDGPTIEVGAGCGQFHDFMPDSVPTDIVTTPWADTQADAEDLPFDDGSAANLVMIDVLHHVPHPAVALAEAERVLMPGGRLVVVEPYCSPLSTFGYRRFHHEPLDLTADPAAPVDQSSDDPFDSNIAIPTLIFWRRPELLREWSPRLHVIGRRRLAWLAYPLCGGFTGRPLLPPAGIRLADRVDALTEALVGPLGGYRCLVSVEKERDSRTAATSAPPTNTAAAASGNH
jgi:SAM-dependent methyltransferase